MDPVLLSRWQFAVTTVYHFFFVPLTLGLGWFLVILETMYLRTGETRYKDLARFWGKLFIINFAMGVVTGIVQEFQFGMNWSAYARYVGDIFGAPLAIEALLTFFLESVFLGVWVFGWERVSKRMHAAAIWLVAIGGTLSAFWILTANGFMQHPVGYEISGGRAQMTDFAALVFNPRAWYFFWHTISAGLVTAAFFVLGISAYHLRKDMQKEPFRISFRIGGILAVVGGLTVIVAGHTQGIYVREVQPMAAAASEALWETADPASFSVVALFDETGMRETWSLQVPYALSMLYYFVPSGPVEGIHNLQAQYEALYGPGDYVPIVALTYWTFRIMVGLGFFMMAVALFVLVASIRKWPSRPQWWMAWMIPGILLPYLANATGWILTENGRQPWIVHGLLKTEAGVSPNVPPEWILASLIGFALVYAVLMVVDIALLVRAAQAGLPPAERRV